MDLSPQFDFATKKIRPKSLPHVETERLTARLQWIDQEFPKTMLDQPLNKMETRHRAGEAASIARELHSRGETPTWSHCDIEHLLGPKQRLPKDNT